MKKKIQDAVLADLLQEHPLPKVKSGVKAGKWAPYGMAKPIPANLR